MIAALVINFGSWYGTDANLQKAADLSALAGAQYIATSASITTVPGDPCASAADPSSCAIDVATDNGVTAGVGDVTSVTATVGSGNSSVTVTAKESVPGLFFTARRTESATASVGGLNGANGYFPATFTCPPPVVEGMCTAANFPAPGTSYSFKFSDTPAPGNFDLLASCNGGSSPDIAQCIYCTTTYSLPNFTPNPLSDKCNSATTAQQCISGGVQGADGKKFNSNPVDSALSWLATQNAVILIPIYTSVSGQGANATYTIAGFAAFLVTGWSNPTISGTFEGWVANTAIEGSCTGAGSDFGVQVFYLSA
jgi:hypothetical protein